MGGHITSYIGEDRAQELIDYADSVYVSFGAPDTVHGRNDPRVAEIAYEASRYNIHLVRCPVRHMGTEYSAVVLGNMYDALCQYSGFTFLGGATADKILVENGKVQGITYIKGGQEYRAYAPYVVAAPGRGGAQWLQNEGNRLDIGMSNNEVDIGVRVEVPNSIMDHLTKPLYEAKLVYYADTFENKVRTFCMNPGGLVSEEHYEGGIAVVNGHSYNDASLRTENTNFAMLVSTHFTKPFGEPIRYGNYIAQLGNMLTGGGVMVQRLGDLLLGRRTDESRLAKSTTRPTLKTAVPGDLSFVLPHRHLTSIIEVLVVAPNDYRSVAPAIVRARKHGIPVVLFNLSFVLPHRHLTSIIEAMRAFDKLAPGLYSRNTLLYGVEVKFYSSKVNVNNRFETSVSGLYAIGDGAGITRGLMQASVTGVCVARDIKKSCK